MTDIMKKANEKVYNIYFMKEIFDYVNTRNYSTQDIVIFNTKLLEAYAKKQFIEVYLPSTHQIVWPQSKLQKKENSEFIDVNSKFLEQFANENDLKIEHKINYENVMKQKPKNEIKRFVSEYMIKELVNRMVLQYDKQDIIESEVKNFESKELPLPPNTDEENIIKKEQYKCEIQYGKFLSHVRDPLNELKSSYINILKIILKSINNQAIKHL